MAVAEWWWLWSECSMRRRKQHIAEDMQPVLVGRRRMQKENRTRQDDVEQISTSQDSNSRFYSSQQKQESVNGYVYRHGKYYATSTKTHRHEAGASRTVLSRLSERHSSVHMKFQGCNRFKICPSIPLYCLLIIILNTLIGGECLPKFIHTHTRTNKWHIHSHSFIV